MEFWMRYRTLKGLDEDGFRRATGVKRATFDGMLKILRPAERERRQNGGPKPKLPLSDRLLMALMDLREYRSYFHIGQTYGVSETACSRSCRWIEETLMRSGAYRLPGRKALLASDTVFETVVIVVTETPIERPKKQKRSYSGKKKRHTLKSHVVVDKKTHQSVCMHVTTQGRRHDRALLRQSGIRLKAETEALLDSGFQGFQKEHPNTRLPYKNTKRKPLTTPQKDDNRRLARARRPEHVGQSRSLGRARDWLSQALPHPRRALPQPTQTLRPAFQPPGRHLQSGAGF